MRVEEGAMGIGPWLRLQFSHLCRFRRSAMAHIWQTRIVCSDKSQFWTLVLFPLSKGILQCSAYKIPARFERNKDWEMRKARRDAHVETWNGRHGHKQQADKICHINSYNTKAVDEAVHNIPARSDPRQIGYQQTWYRNCHKLQWLVEELLGS